MKEIDARGLACPAPVLQTKAALQEESPNGVRVIGSGYLNIQAASFILAGLQVCMAKSYPKISGLLISLENRALKE